MSLTIDRRRFLYLTSGLTLASTFSGIMPARAEYKGSAYFAEAEASGDLPPVAERLPSIPAIAKVDEPGQFGGEISMLMGSAKDTRILVAYSYARLVCYDKDYRLVPDILAGFEVEEEGRRFTFHLRPGHKWSDGKPFTTEAFRYYWEDVALNEELSPVGPPASMVVDGERPHVEIIDEVTIRYSWSKPNAEFLPALAGASPLYIYRPGHYLKRFHKKYQTPEKLEETVKDSGQRNWAALHNRRDNQYRNDNPKLPTLDPWLLRQKPPAERFVFTRNPFYYRVDQLGRQLPYLDQVVFVIADSKIIPAKAGAGESDLQGRNIRFDNYTFLKDGEKSGKNYEVHLWESGFGSNLALYPNLTCKDPVWRALNRDIRFRRALSMGINRHEINQVIYYGLGLEGANTVIPRSPLYKSEYHEAWSNFDSDAANALLDQIGLDKRDDDNWRLLPDGRQAEIIIDASGQATAEADVLELIKDSWAQLGIKLFTKLTQTEVFRNRIFEGESIMSVWTGLDNGIPNEDHSPWELCPSTQQQLQWPKWGQFLETFGESGEEIDLPEAKQLAELLAQWRNSSLSDDRRKYWGQILNIWAAQVYTIGTVANVPQPLVVNRMLKNVPKNGVWSWDPGAQLGVYKPDTFWLAEQRKLSPIPEQKEG